MIKRLNKHITRYISVFKTIAKFSKWYIFLTFFVKVLILTNSYLLLYINKLVINSLSSAIVTGDVSIASIVMLLLITATIEIVSTLLFNIFQYNLGKLKLKYDDEISLKLAKSFSTLDMSYYDDPDSYNQTLQAGKCRVAILDCYNCVLNIAFEILTFLIALVVAVRFSIWILILAMISVLPGMIIRRKLQIEQYNLEKQLLGKQRQADTLLSLFYSKNVELEMQLYDFSDYIENKTKKHQELVRNIRLNNSLKRAKAEGALTVLDKVFYISQQVIMVIAIVNRNMTIGDYTYYGGIIGKLTASFSNIVGAMNNLHISSIKYDEYMAIVSRTPKICTNGTIVVESNDVNTISFENVSFIYPNSSNYALRNINFSFTLGDKLAIVGQNGAGKSTLIKLLLRFYDPTEGRILLNGVDVKEYDLNSYRKLFSAMFQEPMIYLMSLKDNIFISDVNCPEDEIDNRVRQILLDINLSEYNGEAIDINRYCGKEFFADGYAFSTGQKQRVHAARTLFHKGAVYILDEPAASMDAIAETEFLKTLVMYTRGKSVIYITHRYNNLHMMDNIIVLDHGVLKESGKHSELIANENLYTQMFRLQNERDFK